MEFGSFLLQALINPGKAFAHGKGRFLTASLVIGGLSGVAGAWLMRIAGGRELPVNMLRMTIVSVVYFVAMSFLLHLFAVNMGGKDGSYIEFLSLFGFTTIPAILSSLLMHGISAFRLAGFRSSYYPGLFSFGSGWVITMLVFSSAMTIAGYIYQAIALSIVYRLRWTRILGVVLIAAVLGDILISAMLGGLIHTVKVPWETAALMMEDVSEIDVNQHASVDAEWHKPVYETGELVYLRFDTLHLNGRYYTIERKSRPALAEIKALPGETIELKAGTLLVNGQVVQKAEEPLSHLTLETRTMRPNEYFVYFRSPQALSDKTDPEMFIVNKSRIQAAVKQEFLEYLQWWAR